MLSVNAPIIEASAILFLATIIRSAFGFGEALIAVPLLSLLMPVEVAAPVAVLVSITVALIVVVQDWRNVHASSAGRLVLATLFGIPLGLVLLKMVPEAVIKTILAIVIIAFSLFSITRRKHYELKSDRFAWLFGFAAGVLGGAYGMNGPPLVVYGSLRNWPPAQFRATLQGYFLPASIVGMAGYAFSGLWTSTVNQYYLLSLAPVVLAVFAGRVINRRLHHGRFLLYVHGALIVIGLMLLMQALAS
jgi:hypothetical protein